MKENFIDVKSLFDELDYYEKKGFYKLSDQVLTKIQRYAWNMNWDAIFPALRSKLEALKFQNACDFPECRPFFCDKSGGKFLAVKDFTDYIITERRKNPSASIEELKSKFDMASTEKLTGVQLSIGDEDLFMKCLSKIGLQSPSNPKGKLGEGENLVAQNPSGLNPVAPAREPMPPM